MTVDYVFGKPCYGRDDADPSQLPPMSASANYHNPSLGANYAPGGYPFFNYSNQNVPSMPTNEDYRIHAVRLPAFWPYGEKK